MFEFYVPICNYALLSHGFPNINGTVFSTMDDKKKENKVQIGHVMSYAVIGGTVSYVLARITFNDDNLIEFVSVGTLLGGSMSLAKQYNVGINSRTTVEEDVYGESRKVKTIVKQGGEAKSIVGSVAAGAVAYKLAIPIALVGFFGLCLLGFRNKI